MVYVVSVTYLTSSSTSKAPNLNSHAHMYTHTHTHKTHMHQLEAPPDDARAPKQLLDLFGAGVGGDIEILGAPVK